MTTRRSTTREEAQAEWEQTQAEWIATGFPGCEPAFPVAQDEPRMVDEGFVIVEPDEVKTKAQPSTGRKEVWTFTAVVLVAGLRYAFAEATAEGLWLQVSALLLELGVLSGERRLLVLGDGAAWIRTWFEGLGISPKAMILCWWHLRKRCYEQMSSAGGPKDRRRAFEKELLGQLWEGKVDATGGSSGLNNELSVDGADDSDDWIGGFLQNFSPDGIQEFAVRTSNEDADTGWTTAGSVVITTKRGTNDWHGDAAFYERAAQLNARFPIENPAETCTDGTCVDNPKQPFSRQNYVGTFSGPIIKDKVWFFTSFENVHENASIAYSPASIQQFDALSAIATQGLISGVPSIPVPATVPIPFRDYIGSWRLDWAESPRSHAFLRTSEDTYLTHNGLVEQAPPPSTGLITHNNYGNAVISNSYSFSPSWLGNLVLGSSLLHLTQTRNSDLGFALAFSNVVT